MAKFLDNLLSGLGFGASSGLGSILSGLFTSTFGRWINGEDWYNAQTGKALTSAQQQQNAWSAEEAEKSRAFNAAQAAENRQFQVDFYQNYSSPSAMVAQYQDAGINPASVFGNLQGPVASGSSASSAPASAAGIGGVGNLLPSIVSLAELAMQKKKIDVEASYTRQQEKESASRTALNDVDLAFRSAEKELSLEEGRSRISSNLASVEKQLSDVSVNDSVIDVNGHQIQLLDSSVRRNDSEVTLNATRQILSRLEADQCEILLPYLEDYQRAEIAYMSASSEAARSSALLNLRSAEMTVLKTSAEQKLLDNEYYEQLARQAKWSASGSERSYHWAPVNSVVSAIGSVVGAASGVAIGASALKKAFSPVQNPFSPFVGSGRFLGL